MQDKFAVLEQYFGYHAFRGGQEQMIDAIVAGKDALGIMPTGAGKSICFQIPSLILPGVSLVISPLISLMKDQVNALTQAGISAAFLNSTLSPAQMQRVLDYAGNGRYKIIYVAPERLATPDFLAFARSVSIPLVSVDEAHCVSQWGQDFRPSYLKISEFIGSLPHRPTIAAFTATATQQVRRDMVSLLELTDPVVVTTGFDRKNLYYEVKAGRSKYAELCAFLRDRGEQSGIVYCLTRKTVEQVHEKLAAQGYSVSRYHAGLANEERRRNQELFQTDEVKIMVATNAFGMGIDKSNVAFVVHYNMPKNLEAYYQEAGRAGRDGSPADCVLFYSGQDVVTNQFFIDNARENAEMDEESFLLFQQRERERLKKMTFYCHTKDCLRGYILNYFGESAPGYCGNCSNCLHHFERIDITIPAQKILSCIKRMREGYGMKMLADTLRGVSNEKIERLGFDQLSTFGILSDTSEKKLREIINHLILHGYAAPTDGAYPVLRLGEKARDVLFGGESLWMDALKDEQPVVKTKSKQVKLSNPRLYTKLQALRTSIAKAQSVPAYVVFSDASLLEMCEKTPQTEDAFLEISGVGRIKLGKYGAAFLELIRKETE